MVAIGSTSPNTTYYTKESLALFRQGKPTYYGSMAFTITNDSSGGVQSINSYVVPPGRKLLIKSLCLVNDDTSFSVTIYDQTSSTPDSVNLIYAVVLSAAGSTGAMPMDMLVNRGLTFTINSGGSKHLQVFITYELI